MWSKSCLAEHLTSGFSHTWFLLLSKDHLQRHYAQNTYWCPTDIDVIFPGGLRATQHIVISMQRLCIMDNRGKWNSRREFAQETEAVNSFNERFSWVIQQMQRGLKKRWLLQTQKEWRVKWIHILKYNTVLFQPQKVI